ncbi:MAG: hypothetical protein JNL05_12950 [Flavobacteriales bacterium]|nr:hypothetical protein [Flavobacteriales bacterium]
MNKKRDIGALREHLFDTIEGLKAGTVEVKHAQAVAHLANVLVHSVKVEVDALRIIGGQATGFVGDGSALPEAPAPAKASPKATGELTAEHINERYGKVGDRYYSLVDTERGQRKVVEVRWRSLKESLGSLDLVPVYPDREAMEAAMGL